jgi:uncharacterized protein
MKHLKLNNETCYDGSQIEPYWAFKTFGIKDSSIVSWMGPMEIHPNNLIDFEDIGIEIKGDNMLHFIIEHFDSQPADLNLCYHRQRIFVLIVKDVLNDFGMATTREGDDLFFEKGKKKGKLSVSIATCSVSSMKIHFALNLTEKGTPADVETSALLDVGIEKVEEIAKTACNKYISEIKSIKSDITKTKVF